MANELKPIDEWQLPQTTDDLIAFVRIAPSVFSAEQKIIRAMEKQCKDMGVARDMLDKKKEDLNRAGQLYLDAEVMVGEIAERWKEEGNKAKAKENRNGNVAVSGIKAEAKKIGLSERTINRFQAMAKNPDCVEQEKRNSEIENRLPTTNGVMRLIDEKKKRGMPVSHEEEIGYIDADIREADEILRDSKLERIIDSLTELNDSNENELANAIFDKFDKYGSYEFIASIRRKINVIEFSLHEIEIIRGENETGQRKEY